MREPVAAAVVALGKRAEEVDDAGKEQDDERDDGAELDDDGVHLPVGIVEGNPHERFGYAQVRGRANRKKLGQAFNNPQDDGLDVRIQEASSEL
jgi:hypothetical protein